MALPPTTIAKSVTRSSIPKHESISNCSQAYRQVQIKPYGTSPRRSYRNAYWGLLRRQWQVRHKPNQTEVYQVGRSEQDGFQHIKRPASFIHTFFYLLFSITGGFSVMEFPQTSPEPRNLVTLAPWATKPLNISRRPYSFRLDDALLLTAQETKSNCFPKDYIVIFIFSTS